MKTAIIIVLVLSLFLFLACAQQPAMSNSQVNIPTSASVQTGFDDIPQPPAPLGIVEDEAVNG